MQHAIFHHSIVTFSDTVMFFGCVFTGKLNNAVKEALSTVSNANVGASLQDLDKRYGHNI